MKIRADLDPTFFEEGFTEATDPFQKKDLAERLTNLFRSLEQGTVSILAGRWGTGKTVFARQWMRYLQENGVSAIYFDAFASDYAEHPFQVVSSAFIKSAIDHKKQHSSSFNKFVKAAAGVGKKLGATSAKIGTKIVTLGIIGTSEIDDLSKIKDELSSSLGELSEEAAENLLVEQADSEAIFNRLKESLSELPGLLARQDGKNESSEDEQTEDRAPDSLVVIIDELDRCRPDFALGVLEILKHFFRAPGIHFVLVTNMEHLGASVQHRYGGGDFAEEYLQKFYDFVIHFEEKLERHKGSAGKVYAGRLADNLMPSHVRASEADDLKRYLKEIAFAYDLTLRQVEALVTNTLMAYLAVRENELRPVYAVAFLAAVKSQRPHLYKKAGHGRMSYTEFEEFIDSGEWDEDFSIDRMKKIFRYFLDPDINPHDDEWSEFASGWAQYHFLSRLDIVPYVCNALLDRLGKA